jgi:hypothetical protein
MTAVGRALLALVAATQAEVGVWGEVAPHSFYENFPGFGRHWVSPLGQYNEHLVRDYASAEIGFAVLLACAAIWFIRPVVLIAGAAFLAATLPHFIFHLTTTDKLPSIDNTLSLGGFVVEMALVVAAMAVVIRQRRRLRWPDSLPPSPAESTPSAV